MSVVPGPYRITSHLSPNPAIGVDPKSKSAIKPVVVAPPKYAPDGTTWQVEWKDNQFYLLVVNSANTRSEEDRVSAFYAQPGEMWRIVYDSDRKGILSPENASLGWYLPNAKYGTQLCLRGINPGEGHYFNLEMLVDG